VLPDESGFDVAERLARSCSHVVLTSSREQSAWEAASAGAAHSSPVAAQRSATTELRTPRYADALIVSVGSWAKYSIGPVERAARDEGEREENVTAQ
jgi:hypothetical protein